MEEIYNVEVTLRKLTVWDTETYYELSQASDIKKHLPWMSKDSLYASVPIVYQLANANFENSFAFMIENANCSLPVGIIEATSNSCYNSLDVTFFIGTSHRNMGYMKAAIHKFVTFVKENTNYYSLFFDVASSNTKAERLLYNVGATYLGILPDWPLEQIERFEIVL